MSFKNKEYQIIAALETRGYEIFGHQQNKERVLQLLERNLLTFPEYANIVIREQIMMPIWKYRCEPEDLRINIQRIDTERRHAHDSAITAVDWLNRLCNELEISPFAEINTKDRHAVAELVGNIVGEMYNIGIGKTFDEITQTDTEYSIQTQKKSMMEIIKECEKECASNKNTIVKEGNEEHEEI